MSRLAGVTASFQGLGRSLMLPIAVLPIAGLLLRLGQPDIADPVAALLPLVKLGFLATAGNAVFDNLGLLFAIGVAIGFARENHGAAGLAGVIGFVVATEGAAALVQVPGATVRGLAPELAALASAGFRHKAIHDLAVPVGIICGVMAGWSYNRFHAIRLPEYLAFFGGRRFVPIVMGLFGVVFAGLLGNGYAALHAGITGLSNGVAQGGMAGLFLYGALNRLLIVTGLHHILNNVVWFILGDWHGATGDLRRFFAGDPAAGAFMAGFFPVMMFGLPAACLAMYSTARPERRKEVGGMLLSQALTSFLTGVTEPVEFSFMFLAPALYALHMVLTGLAFVILAWLDVKLGFSFSAGLFDYVINFGLATHPWRLLPVGLGFAAVYYTGFRWAIVRFDIATPGREARDEVAEERVAAGSEGAAWLAALGGRGNIVTLGACTTRLRLQVRERAGVDEAALKRLGARGIVWPAAGTLQVIVGPDADRIAGEIGMMRGDAVAEPAAPVALSAAQAAALGGAANLRAVAGHGTRIVAELADPALLDAAGLEAAGVLASAFTAGGRVHLIVNYP
ncbi:MAG: N-acetylglucosamine-specific PTS transporter subunit IIBC [Sphingomonadales bacterium]|nr:N-acetylglucosamine-specific PTS transporter subunit IIBC [Sphingomonadales bacterium]